MNLILGSCAGYAPGKIRPFVESLRRHYSGAAALATWGLPPASKALLMRHGIAQVEINIPPPAESVIRLRHYAYHQILLAHPEVDRVFLTDVRDVVFQGDPFALLPEAALVVFLEDNTIGVCPYNSVWVRQAYGPERLETLASCTISCAGTVAGSRDGILRYLELMCRELSIQKGKRPTIDQGHHNHLVYGELADIAVRVENRTGAAQSLFYQQRFEFDRLGRLVNTDGRVCPVIHQYDRHPVFFPILGINPAEYLA